MIRRSGIPRCSLLLAGSSQGRKYVIRGPDHRNQIIRGHTTCNTSEHAKPGTRHVTTQAGGVWCLPGSGLGVLWMLQGHSTRQATIHLGSTQARPGSCPLILQAAPRGVRQQQQQQGGRQQQRQRKGSAWSPRRSPVMSPGRSPGRSGQASVLSRVPQTRSHAAGSRASEVAMMAAAAAARMLKLWVSRGR